MRFTTTELLGSEKGYYGALQKRWEIDSFNGKYHSRFSGQRV